ncbi:MAG TPA: hypothetical protein VLE70_09610 [Anaerolineae bacterium]|nr:hypothetical protein [Anaerolineae bacterium]
MRRRVVRQWGRLPISINFGQFPKQLPTVALHGRAAGLGWFSQQGDDLWLQGRLLEGQAGHGLHGEGLDDLAVVGQVGTQDGQGLATLGHVQIEPGQHVGHVPADFLLFDGGDHFVYAADGAPVAAG